ncbi:hypothetical protein [Longimicrobium sp.]|uniref:hypothetical protein n=1 Tax=Longimicrobium sp. TaxID=2029185 RepID=UPI002CDA364F|nr:hypothetical protein [Longimicrobium sp.]HSU15012.1 hypothetical protein [Longimicrobium sp.]
MKMPHTTALKQRLSVDALRVETFEAGEAMVIAPPTINTGRDSTCACCSDPFTCPCSYPACRA